MHHLCPWCIIMLFSFHHWNQFQKCVSTVYDMPMFRKSSILGISGPIFGLVTDTPKSGTTRRRHHDDNTLLRGVKSEKGIVWWVAEKNKRRRMPDALPRPYHAQPNSTGPGSSGWWSVRGTFTNTLKMQIPWSRIRKDSWLFSRREHNSVTIWWRKPSLSSFLQLISISFSSI